MFDVTLLILLGLAALGFISHNTTVAVSILVLIIVRVTPLSTFFPWIEKQGLSIGIIILTIGVMAPIASGTLPPSTLIHSFLNWKSLVAIAVGVIVSWLGGRGVYSAAIFLIPICISFDTAEKRRYATYLILNRRFSFEF